jgi:hypothetical protein
MIINPSRFMISIAKVKFGTMPALSMKAKGSRKIADASRT